MVPFLMDDDPILFSAASTLKMKLFRVNDNLLAVDEDGEKTLFAKLEDEDDVIFTLVPDDESLQDKCSKMLVSVVLAEIKEQIQHPERFNYDVEQMQTLLKTKRFLSSIRRYFKRQGEIND